MKNAMILFALSCSLVGCDKGKLEEKPTATKTQPAPVLATPSIASVQLGDDCPDPKPTREPAPEEEAMRGLTEERKSAGDSADRVAGWQPPCVQSSMQIAFSGQGKSTSKVRIKKIRLLGSDGKTLATIKHRLPTIWKAGTYQAWDQVLPANADQKTSYKLSPPNWSKVESANSGAMFVLEVELEIGGKKSTIRSSKFDRERPEMIET